MRYLSWYSDVVWTAVLQISSEVNCVLELLRDAFHARLSIMELIMEVNELLDLTFGLV